MLARQRGYYSPNSCAVIAAALDYHRKKTINEYNKIVSLDIPPTNEIELAQEKKKSEANGQIDLLPSLQDIQKLVNPGNGWIGGAIHFATKNINTLSYLTDEKSRIISRALLCFHPEHPNNNDWVYNPYLPFHQDLIHQCFERETRLLDVISQAVEKNNSSKLLIFDESNTQNTTILKQIDGCFSPIAKAVIAGLLLQAKRDKSKQVEMSRIIKSVPPQNPASLVKPAPPKPENEWIEIPGPKPPKQSDPSEPKPENAPITSPIPEKKIDIGSILKHSSPPIPIPGAQEREASPETPTEEDPALALKKLFKSPGTPE